MMLGISMQSGENVVAVGERLSRRVRELADTVPVGMELTQIYNQPVEVNNSVKGFVVSVGQAVAIVIGVLLLVVGTVGLLAPLIGHGGVIGLLAVMGLAGAALGMTLPATE